MKRKKISGKAMTKIQVKDSAQRILANVIHDFPDDRCWNCSSFQEFLIHLEKKSQGDIFKITEPYKISKEKMHQSLDCDPCPPVDAYIDYVLE